MRLLFVVSLSFAAAAAWSPRPAAADPGVERELRDVSDRLARTPGAAALLLRRADLLRRLGRFDAALGDLDVAEATGADRGPVDLGRAFTFADAGDGARAVRLLEGSLSLMDPGAQRSAYALLATLHERFDRIDDAVLAYDRALELRPDVQLYLSRGRLLTGVGRGAAAIEGLEEGVLALGGPAVLRRELITLYLAGHRPEPAIDHAAVLVASARAKSPWLLLRAEAYEQAGDHRRATVDREAALVDAERVLLRRASATALLARAQALHALGRDGEARSDLQQVVRRAPRNRQARALLHALGEGGAR